MTVRSPVRYFSPLTASIRTAVLALGAQAALAFVYLATTDAGLAAPTTMAIPLVWLTTAAVAVRHAEPPAGGVRTRVVAGVVGLAYGVGLAVVAGMIQRSAGMAGTNVVLLPPWWGPAVQFAGLGLAGTLFPYRLVGYAALAYLVYIAVADALARGAGAVRGAGGAVGALSCTGCALPLIASLGGAAGGIAGGVTALLAGSPTYTIGTIAYVVAVGLLAYRAGTTDSG